MREHSTTTTTTRTTKEKIRMKTPIQLGWFYHYYYFILLWLDRADLVGTLDMNCRNGKLFYNYDLPLVHTVRYSTISTLDIFVALGGRKWIDSTGFDQTHEIRKLHFISVERIVCECLCVPVWDFLPTNWWCIRCNFHFSNNQRREYPNSVLSLTSMYITQLRLLMQRNKYPNRMLWHVPSFFAVRIYSM